MLWHGAVPDAERQGAEVSKKAEKQNGADGSRGKAQGWIDYQLADMQDPNSKIYGAGKVSEYNLTLLANAYGKLGGVFEELPKELASLNLGERILARSNHYGPTLESLMSKGQIKLTSSRPWKEALKLHGKKLRQLSKQEPLYVSAVWLAANYCLDGHERNEGIWDCNRMWGCLARVQCELDAPQPAELEKALLDARADAFEVFRENKPGTGKHLQGRKALKYCVELAKRLKMPEDFVARLETERAVMLKEDKEARQGAAAEEKQWFGAACMAAKHGWPKVLAEALDKLKAMGKLELADGKAEEGVLQAQPVRILDWCIAKGKLDCARLLLDAGAPFLKPGPGNPFLPFRTAALAAGREKEAQEFLLYIKGKAADEMQAKGMGKEEAENSVEAWLTGAANGLGAAESKSAFEKVLLHAASGLLEQQGKAQAIGAAKAKGPRL